MSAIFALKYSLPFKVSVIKSESVIHHYNGHFFVGEDGMRAQVTRYQTMTEHLVVIGYFGVFFNGIQLKSMVDLLNKAYWDFANIVILTRIRYSIKDKHN